MTSWSGPLSAADVRALRFGKPPIGKRGYAVDDVDAFLERCAQALEGTGAPVSAGDVHRAVFRRPRFGHRGYDEQQVDAALDEVERALATGS